MTPTIVWITLTFVGFAVIHSLTAGKSFADRLKRSVPARVVDGWYRLAYNALSLLTFAPVLAVAVLMPDSSLYVVGRPLALVLRVVQLAALAGLGWSLWSIDFWRFAGLRQAWAYFNGDDLPLRDEPLQQNGVYALMRHPLYVFSLVALWANPIGTVSSLVFNICATLYFGIGSQIEERRLTAAYGDDYRHYRRTVRW